MIPWAQAETGCGKPEKRRRGRCQRFLVVFFLLRRCIAKAIARACSRDLPAASSAFRLASKVAFDVPDFSGNARSQQLVTENSSSAWTLNRYRPIETWAFAVPMSPAARLSTESPMSLNAILSAAQ